MPGDVIRLDDRRTARAPRPASADARGDAGTPAGPDGLGDGPSPEQQLAETIEAILISRGFTLADTATSTVYTATLDAVLLMLEGAQVEGVIEAVQHRALAGMIHGMRDAPGRV
ncbi:hypothetical protein [Streptomyces hebeiensis]